MHILITGASGLVGTALAAALRLREHSVWTLVRRTPAAETEIAWDPARGAIDAARLEGMDAVVHLAGENIAAGRWTPERKARIRDSRIEGTRLLAETLAGLQRRPAVFLSASGINYYGDRGDEALTEASGPGAGFLPDLCVAWEHAAQPAKEAGIRTIQTRLGMVLSPKGGALAKMLTPFKFGLGGVIGSGAQYMSWIAIDDLIDLLCHSLESATLDGSINAVAPNPVTNREFTGTLGRVLGRPTLFPLPAFAARLAFGEMADALLLSSLRVLPTRLQAESFPFAYPHLEPALRHLLGK